MRFLFGVLALLGAQLASAQQLAIGGNLHGDGSITFNGSTMTGHLYGNGDLVFAGLTPFSITSPTNGQCLTFSTSVSAWINSACGGGGGSGTVTTVSVVSANGLSGTVANPTTTPAITLAPTFTGIAYSTGATLQAAIAANFPMLNQSTTGNAATATALAAVPAGCAANQYANAIAASGNLTCAQIAAAQVTGLAASATTDTTNAGNISSGILAVLRGGTGVSTATGTGSVVLSTSPTLVTPALGTPSAINLSNATALPLSALANKGTTTTVLHGNAAGNPSFSAVNLASDVTGILSLANFATCSTSQVLFASSSTAGACSSKLTWNDSTSVFTVAPASTAATLQFGPRSFLETNAGQNFILCQDNRPGFTHLVPGTTNCTTANIISAVDDMQFIGANGPKFEFIAPTVGASLGTVVVDFQNSSSDGWTFTFNDPAETTCGEVSQPAWAFTAGQTECMFFNTEGLPFLLGPGNTDMFINSANTETIFAIGATPLKWLDVTNTGGSNTTVLGDSSNSSSITNIKGGSAANTQANGVPIVAQSRTAPSVSSGFGSGASVTNNLGPRSFSVNVGTGGAASSGVVGLPTAAHGWACHVADVTTPTGNSTQQTSSSTTTATFTNFSRTLGTASAWPASDILEVSCWEN